MSCPTSMVLRVIGSSRKQLLARPRGSRSRHTGHQEPKVSNGKRIWLAGRIHFSLLLLKFISTEISLPPIKSGKVAAGLGVGVVLIGNWVEGNMGNTATFSEDMGNTGNMGNTGTLSKDAGNTGTFSEDLGNTATFSEDMGNTGTLSVLKQDTGEHIIQDEGRPANQDTGRHTKQEIGRSVGPDLEGVQNSSKLKPVDKNDGGEMEQDNQVLPEDKSLNNVNDSSQGTAKERSTNAVAPIRGRSEESVETLSYMSDCDHSLPTEEAQSPNSAIVVHRQYSSNRTFGQQLAHVIWVGLRLSQILLSILLPTTLIFLRWM